MPTSRRLAMLAAEVSHETPRTRVNGLESFAEVVGKADGDVVEMVVQLKGGESLTIPLQEGSTALSVSKDWQSYYFRKVAGSSSRPTTIYTVLASA